MLRDRIYDGMAAAWKATERQPITGLEWRVEPVKLPPRREKSFRRGGEHARCWTIRRQTKAKRQQRRVSAGLAEARLERPIDLTCLDLGKAQVLHLPGEPFIEYQLKAQRAAAGSLRVRGRLRRRRAGLHSDRAGPTSKAATSRRSRWPARRARRSFIRRWRSCSRRRRSGSDISRLATLRRSVERFCEASLYITSSAAEARIA